MGSELHRLAVQLAEALAAKNCQIVFAESCTGGLVAATLATVPGISQFLCGSSVVYQEMTKQCWLGIEKSVLDRQGAVSSPVTRNLAKNVLDKTPHANLAVAVTGHLGPLAPPQLDGIVFIGWARRAAGGRVRTAPVTRHVLTVAKRRERQQEATQLVLVTALQALERIPRVQP